ncbi:UNKNOWN [Stylonychia lemnae]|uniref:Uncharacterized protein n=1 Tax=Stylonychia lemnae TaxID=5949 RepID=A0A078A3M6_STYLE|nr:UNKNOWN [Stylonychia lemnae]|eukprot:CDW75349.1 UNKNOWN [Stylonychia lemnae]
MMSTYEVDQNKGESKQKIYLNQILKNNQSKKIFDKQDFYNPDNYIKLKQLLKSEQSHSKNDIKLSFPEFGIIEEKIVDYSQPISRFQLVEYENIAPYFQNLMVRTGEATNQSISRANSKEGNRKQKTIINSSKEIIQEEVVNSLNSYQIAIDSKDRVPMSILKQLDFKNQSLSIRSSKVYNQTPNMISKVSSIVNQQQLKSCSSILRLQEQLKESAQQSVKQPLKCVSVLDDKHLNEKLKDKNPTQISIEDVIRERRQERATSSQNLHRVPTAQRQMKVVRSKYNLETFTPFNEEINEANIKFIQSPSRTFESSKYDRASRDLTPKLILNPRIKLRYQAKAMQIFNNMKF